MIYGFGIFELDPEAGELRRNGRRVPLQEQPLKILELLLEAPGKVVSRDELRRRLWPPDVHVDFDNSLNAAVGRLREALGDGADNPRFVATVPRRGYRFIAPVRHLTGPAERGEKPRPWRAWLGPEVVRWVKIVALLAPVLIVAAFLMGILEGRRRAHAPPPPAPSPLVKLAVLPFENVRADSMQEFLNDGLTEELIALLGRLHPERLRVIARTSVMVFKGTGTGVDEIGRRLDVDFVLEGTVRQEGDAVRITAALVEVAGQTQVWSASFDRTLTTLMTLEREIATEVAGALALELLPPEPAAVPGGRAHRLYLEGRYFLSQLTPEGFRKAVRAFEGALVENPLHAASHSGLAVAWALQGSYDFAPRDAAYPRAIELALRALELDPASAEGHLTLAYLRYVYEWDFAAADESFRRALALNPSLARAHLFYAGYLSSLGRHDEALAAAGRALELDPLSLPVNADRCWRLFLARRFEAAIAQCRRTLELDPEFLVAQDNLKWIHIRRGDEDEAVAAFLRVVELEERDADNVASLRALAAKEGLKGLLRNSLVAAEERAEAPGQSPYNIALDFAALGEVDAALAWLERSFTERETDLVDFAVDPRLDVLRGEVRFRELLRRTRLPRNNSSPRRSSGVW